MIALCIDIDEAGDWRKARFDKQGLRMMKAALGAELKVKEGDIGDFIGYIIQDYSLRPDIFRLAAKVIGRRFSLGSDVSAAQRENYFADYPELRNARQAGMLSLYHNVAEYQNAVFDRLSTIRTEDDRVKTIRANASYYMPNVAAQEAHAKVGLILDALATFAQRRYTSIYYNELRRRIKRMHFLPIENAADGGDQSHIIMDNESAGRVIEDLRMIDRVVRPVEEYNYVVDDGWRFTLKERIVRAAEAVIRPFWLRLLDAVDARIRRSRFATKLWWLTWLINKVRPKQDDAALEPVAYDDEDEESNQGDANINQALNVEEEDVAGNAALEAAIGIVDYYEATEARVNNCLKADPNCTKIFADFRGVKKYESGAAYKLLDCLTEEQEELFALEGNAVTVCDIGCGPGGCTQVFCEYPGINRVIAINAPHEYPGSVKMRYMNPKIDLRQVDAATLTTLPEADYYFSDIQNLPTNVALEWFGAADDERPIAIKINHLDDNLALALGERACILKPRRSNRYSSEFYLLSYEHPQATTLQQFITNWALAVGDLEARRIPNPYPSVDNELAGRDTRVLSEAFETITQKQRQIRSAVQLADMLKRAGVNFTISQNRQILHENDKGRIGRYWEIDLDLGSVTCVEDQPGKKKVEQVAEEEELTSDDDDLEVDNGADAEHDDFDYEAARQENLVFEAAGRANAAFAPVCRENFSDFEIAVIGPFFEECARSLVIRWTSLHPVAFSHFFGFVRDRMQGINNTADLYSTFMLLGAKRQHFLLRVIHHISQNALFVRVPGLWFKLFSFLRCATQADNITHVILSAIAVGIDFYTGHNFASAATHAIFLTVGFFENIRDCKIKDIPEVASMGYLYTHIYHRLIRNFIPEILRFDFSSIKTKYGAMAKQLIDSARLIKIEVAPPNFSSEAEFGKWVESVNATIMATVEANMSAANMNIPSTPAFAGFEPVNANNKLACLVDFNGAQPVQPITFASPQPVQPITFASEQPTYFKEPQHVIVDENPGEKIFDILKELAVLAVKEGETSAWKITNNNSALEVTGGTSATTSDVRIIACTTQLPVDVQKAIKQTADVTLVGTNSNPFVSISTTAAKLPVRFDQPTGAVDVRVTNTPLPVTGLSSANGVLRCVANFTLLRYEPYGIATYFWGIFRTSENYGVANETIDAALRRLGFTGSDGKAIVDFTMRFKANHVGFSDDNATRKPYATIERMSFLYQGSSDFANPILKVSVGQIPKDVLSLGGNGPLSVLCAGNQTTFYNRNNCELIVECERL